MTSKQRIVRGLWLASLAGSSNGWATELVYTPNNPSFGGNPLNGNFLLGKAQAENRFRDPDLRNPFAQTDPVRRFQDDLQRQIFSRLARDITDQMFGEGGLGEGGVYNTGDYTVEVITTDPDNVTLRITNNLTQAVTIIQVPAFGAGSGG